MSNHLAQETSPYLKQHADNPVDWYPWDQLALEKACNENKPILLSIGYSACHWCHVMAQESFADEQTAQIMNEHFINIKVDREERPDLDKIYQTAYQLLNQQGGGWPLTVFLSPHDLTPFYAGTYFPKTPRYGMSSFKQILLTVQQAFEDQSAAIKVQNQRLRESLNTLYASTAQAETLSDAPLKALLVTLVDDYDPNYGGFGSAPKFPNSSYLQCLLQHADDNPQYLHILEFTLKKMAASGIYDQLSGGFYRYSVDEQWMIPHFEKMLYDNATLLALYAQTYAKTQDVFYKKIGIELANWIIKDMQAPSGGYFTSIDADSEHQEGKYYVWKHQQIKRALDDQEYQLFNAYYGLDQVENFEGSWHLHQVESFDTVCQKLSLSLSDGEKLLQHAKQKLLALRQQRIAPQRDEKILTAWNGLMIKAMTLAGFHLQQAEFIKSAQAALEFIQTHTWENKRLMACHKDGRARFNAYLDDYAFLLDAVMTLLQVQGKNEYLSFAKDLASSLVEYFYDENKGGFFFTASDHEPLILRPKQFSDDSIPCGNAIAISALNKLGQILGDDDYLQIAENSLKAAWPVMNQYPSAHSAMINALDEILTIKR